MNVLRTLAVVLALVTLASLPCVIAWLVVNADDMSERAEAARRRLPVLRHHPEPPSVDRIAAELRRLSAELAEAAGAPARRELLRAAHDRALRSACAALGLDEYLGDTDGLDREIERVRVLGVLQRAGLDVDGTATGPAAKRRDGS